MIAHENSSKEFEENLFNEIRDNISVQFSHEINAYIIDLDNCASLIKDFEDFSKILFNVLDVLNDVEEDELEDYTP
ncbi:MAG: hypothetical protein JWM44_1075 [Bacilli bacterium]|nr:hypothetical protein [Bacilli bacterium]